MRQIKVTISLDKHISYKLTHHV